MANQWRDLIAGVDRIMRLRTLLDDHDNPPELIRRKKGVPRSLHYPRIERLKRAEAQLPELIEAAFSTGPERNRRTKDDH